MTEREGQTPDTALEILRKPVPRWTGFGRQLTPAETRDLRRAGHRVPRGTIVVPAADVGSLCIIYRPDPTGGYTHSGIYVTGRG
jgi:hypothetical protein